MEVGGVKSKIYGVMCVGPEFYSELDSSFVGVGGPASMCISKLMKNVVNCYRTN